MNKKKKEKRRWKGKVGPLYKVYDKRVCKPPLAMQKGVRGGRMERAKEKKPASKDEYKRKMKKRKHLEDHLTMC